MVRDYILHDRGNSLFLSDSFANLPSPVNEGRTIKQLFKNNQDENEMKPKKSSQHPKYTNSSGDNQSGDPK
jgi:hypothetical protein